MHDRFLEVFLDTNNVCNLRCVMCGFSDQRVDKLAKYKMPFPLFERIAAEVFPHAQYVALSCLTEPLMTRGFSDYIRHAGTYEIPRLEFVTNAMLLTDEHLEACVEAGLWGIAISVDGGDRESYETVCRNASWDKLVRAIVRTREVFDGAPAGPRLRVIMTLVKENFRTVPDAVRKFIEWGVCEAEIRETISWPGIEIEKRQLQDHREELRDLFVEAQALAGEAGLPLTILTMNAAGMSTISRETQPPCPALERRLAISANGDVTPCMLWAKEPLGNLREMTFDEIWSSEPRQRYLPDFRDGKVPLWCTDCPYCQRDDEPDDSFYQLLSRPAPDIAVEQK